MKESLGGVAVCVFGLVRHFKRPPKQQNVWLRLCEEKEKTTTKQKHDKVTSTHRWLSTHCSKRKQRSLLRDEWRSEPNLETESRQSYARRVPQCQRLFMQKGKKNQTKKNSTNPRHSSSLMSVFFGISFAMSGGRITCLRSRVVRCARASKRAVSCGSGGRRHNSKTASSTLRPAAARRRAASKRAARTPHARALS